MDTQEDFAEQRRQKEISDAMDSYYNPQKWVEDRRRERAFKERISNEFVQGLPY